MLIALILSVAVNLGSYWYSDKIVLRMYKAREAVPAESPVLHRIVSSLADRAGLPMPGVYIVDAAMPNAFATGRDPAHAAVAVTTGILKVLERDELEGVLAHELAHVKNRDTLISAMAATIAGVVTYMATIARWGMIFGSGSRNNNDGNAIGVLATAILAPVAAMLIQMAISRGREFGADEGGARICGKPAALASALAKLEGASRGIKADVNPTTAHMFIVNPLSGKAMSSLFSTHPSTEERIKRLMAMP